MNPIHVDIKSHYYGDICALDSCNLTLLPNSLTAIVGPNGGGKSTLLKLIAGLFPPTDGSIDLGGISPKGIAYLAQAKEIDRTFPIRVEDVVAMGLWPQSGIFKSFQKRDRDTISRSLEKVGLAGFEKRSISALSGGQLQRLFFARVIAQDAGLILLDEPFTGIDRPTVFDLLKLIQEWHEEGKTVLAVLHEIKLVKNYFPNTILVSKHLISNGNTEDVFTVENLTKATFNV